MNEELHTGLAGKSRAEVVKAVRKEFGRTQEELATALGVSTKAVQSYEQGWRDVPVRVLIQLFVLLSIFRRRTEDQVPCWEITGCPEEHRNVCPSYAISQGQFCWFVTGRSNCSQATEEDELFPCARCDVIRRLLRDQPVGPSTAPGT